MSVFYPSKYFTNERSRIICCSWRQSGPVAAAAKYALEANYPNRLRDTHKLARQFASEMSQCGVLITKPVHTNTIWMDISPLGITSNVLRTELAKEKIRIFDTDETNLRLIVHYQIVPDALSKFVNIIRKLAKVQEAVMNQ